MCPGRASGRGVLSFVVLMLLTECAMLTRNVGVAVAVAWSTAWPIMNDEAVSVAVAGPFDVSVSPRACDAQGPSRADRCASTIELRSRSLSRTGADCLDAWCVTISPGY